VRNLIGDIWKIRAMAPALKIQQADAGAKTIARINGLASDLRIETKGAVT
jgi:hypothetical protein